MQRKRVVAVAIATLTVALGQLTTGRAGTQSGGGAALSGVVRSSGEGRLEGVVVSARRDGANFTVSVVTDETGTYRFPRTYLERRLVDTGSASPSLHHAIAAQTASVVVFERVNVVPMDRERVLANQTVVVRDGRIAAIGPADNVEAPAGATLVDGRGQFLMPTLAEMHAHLLPQYAAPYAAGRFETPEDAIERVLLLYVLNGIGTIRNMTGQASHIALRERVASGEVLGPTIITSGDPFRNEHTESVEAAERLVAEQKALGFDFLKVWPQLPPSVMPPDVWDAMVAAANEAGLPFAGHVPSSQGLQGALDARIQTVDHLDGYLEAAARPGAPRPVMFATNLVGYVDESRFLALAEETKAAGTWMVPTQSLLESQWGPDDPSVMAGWPDMEYVSPRQVEQWTNAKMRTMNAQPLETRQEYIAIRRRLLKTLYDSGVKFLLGSDAPQTWSVPGFSIHRELAVLVASGLTPYQALETGTRNVAVFLKTEDRTGTVEMGKRADLLLVAADPLEDVANAQKITGVMLNGRWLPRVEIEERLKE